MVNPSYLDQFRKSHPEEMQGPVGICVKEVLRDKGFIFAQYLEVDLGAEKPPRHVGEEEIPVAVGMEGARMFGGMESDTVTGPFPVHTISTAGSLSISQLQDGKDFKFGEWVFREIELLRANTNREFLELAMRGTSPPAQIKKAVLWDIVTMAIQQGMHIWGADDLEFPEVSPFGADPITIDKYAYEVESVLPKGTILVGKEMGKIRLVKAPALQIVPSGGVAVVFKYFMKVSGFVNPGLATIFEVTDV